MFFTPWSPELTAHPEQSRQFIDAQAKRGYAAAGLTESFRGYDGIQVIAAAIEAAGSADPAAVGKALWDVKVKNLNGEVVFRKSGPEGRESAQSDPSIYFVKIYRWQSRRSPIAASVSPPFGAPVLKRRLSPGLDRPCGTVSTGTRPNFADLAPVGILVSRVIEPS